MLIHKLILEQGKRKKKKHILSMIGLLLTTILGRYYWPIVKVRKTEAQRAQGSDRTEIQIQLSLSKSTCSL